MLEEYTNKIKNHFCDGAFYLTPLNSKIGIDSEFLIR